MWLLSCQPEHWERPLMEITTVALDLAKNVFQVHDSLLKNGII
jgi:hypothetical protein